MELKETIKIKYDKYLVIGSLFFVIGFFLLAMTNCIDQNKEKLEDESVKHYYDTEIIEEAIENETKEEPVEEIKENNKKQKVINYIGVINIPKVNLEKGLVEKDSYLNNISKNIEILNESDMPDIENGNFILASHSGNGAIAFFKDIHKLRQDDLISINYKQIKYDYKVVNMYHVEKNGSAHIVRNANKDTLTLITCVDGEEKQLIVIAEKVKI